MEAMEHAIPVKMLKSFPVLVTRYLCGAASSADLGLNQRTGWFSRFAFSSLMFSVRVIDWLGGGYSRNSRSRAFSRGYWAITS